MTDALGSFLTETRASPGLTEQIEKDVGFKSFNIFYVKRCQQRCSLLILPECLRIKPVSTSMSLFVDNSCL